MYARIVKPGWLVNYLPGAGFDIIRMRVGLIDIIKHKGWGPTVALPQMMAKGKIYETGTIYAYLQIDRWWHPSPDKKKPRIAGLFFVWRWMQSDANSSPRKSLINGKIQGNNWKSPQVVTITPVITPKIKLL